MSWAVEYIVSFHNWWNNVNAVKTTIHTQKLSTLQSASPSDTPFLRIGVLSAAAINWTAIFDPVSTHPGAVITGIAARDKSRAEAQIAANKAFLPAACTAYGSYDALVSAPDIDAVYISLPNGLHYKWALAALEKGKHVLIEKPVTSNAQEARELRAAARKAGKVALEAFHWRFHPSVHVVKSLLLSGEYGRLLSVDARALLPGFVLPKNDIRFQYSLGGGCSMDLTYVFSAVACFAARDIADANVEFDVVEAHARINARDKFIDDAISATLRIKDPHPYGGEPSSSSSPGEVKATLTADLAQPKLFGLIPPLPRSPAITLQTEGAEIVFDNFMAPWLSHSVTVTPVTRDPASHKILKRGKRKTLKQFKGGPLWDRELADRGGGEEWWSTYRWQLEAFTRKIAQGDAYQGPDVTLDESVRVMELIDAVYQKVGLPLRGLQTG